MREGSKLVEEEIALITKQIREEASQNVVVSDSTKYRVKIKWRAGKDDPNNGGYNQQLLHKFLSKVVILYQYILYCKYIYVYSMEILMH